MGLVAPIDYTPLEKQLFYKTMITRLDSFQVSEYAPQKPLHVGWSQFSIVPDYPMPLAGYKPRDAFTEVHDSVYMRIMAIDNGGTTVFLVTADLLLFPPALKDRILGKLGTSWRDFVYFSATHTHTSVGGWDPSLLGTLLMGSFDEYYVEKLADQTVEHLTEAKANLLPAYVGYWEKDIRENIYNRIDRSAAMDSKFRGLSVMRNDGSKALLFVLGAHPTAISKNFTSLSGDYPAAIMNELKDEYQFTQFMAGAIGSQSFKGFGRAFNFDLVDSVGGTFTRHIRKADPPSFMLPDVIVKTGRFQIPYGTSQLRLTKDIKLRDWVFRYLSKPLEGEITVLQIGSVLMIGTPCDFSGEISVVNELEQYANARGLKLIITSFNGEYNGYITADSHYETADHEEVRILNWVGPHFGKYYTEMIKSVIDKVAAY